MDKPIALIYKKSIYQIYFLEGGRKAATLAKNKFNDADIERLRESHESHEQTLQQVEAYLNSEGLAYKKVYRARMLDSAPYGLVISVGGDGTFIEASCRVTTQMIIGVNSDPERSVGVYCVATAQTLPAYITAIQRDEIQPQRLTRIGLELDGQQLAFSVLNDVLVAHQHPGAMSVYELSVNGQTEKQYGSGLWVSTPAGSTGAIRSAGGQVMARGSRKLQYLGRELFHGREVDYRLRQGSVALESPIMVKSCMREGMIYVDGAHLRIPFPFGATLKIRASQYPLCMIPALG